MVGRNLPQAAQQTRVVPRCVLDRQVPRPQTRKCRIEPRGQQPHLPQRRALRSLFFFFFLRKKKRRAEGLPCCIPRMVQGQEQRTPPQIKKKGPKDKFQMSNTGGPSCGVYLRGPGVYLRGPALESLLHLHDLFVKSCLCLGQLFLRNYQLSFRSNNVAEVLLHDLA